MARTEVTERIAGETLRLSVTIGVIEAVAEIEDSMLSAIGRVQVGSYRVTRAAMVQMLKDAGKPDPDKWFDDAIEKVGLAPFSALVFRALQDAFAKSADASGKADAAGETERPETVAS